MIKKTTLFQFIEKVISKLLKIIALLHFYQRIQKHICVKIYVKYLNTCIKLNFFFENDLISPKQSDFPPENPCINQLLSINHETINAFDVGLEVGGSFLDILKAFDKVLHAGLTQTLRQNGIYGGLIVMVILSSNLL